MSRLHQHPAFPALHHCGDQFMVMDKVEGITLAHELHNRSRLKEDHLEQIEAYMEDCFREGWIPRDMHLNNLMVDAEDRIRIVDVGRFIHTDYPERYQEELAEDLADLRYDLLGMFSPFSKKRRYHYGSSSSGSYRRRRSYSSRSYSSSRRKYRKHRRRRPRSSS
ncbi:MAG: AarF/UbiB family protein [Firmicutes bacterium]|uniref:AarF/UbiB family protein n=1 Tax=Melghirimyces thermohalophilus TaxID=1236220 RepID=UPI000B88EF32|nr:AarF/UbiB family protein [Melghirimyces thermohalophilus]MDA8351704.1 AarF/UbiB family protein [Bacillota bacterium]